MTPDIEKIDRALRNKRDIGPLAKIKIYQLASREWRRHLTPYEIVVVTYIVDRTVGWGRNHFIAAHANVLHGTDDYSGIGLTERTYYKALSSLEKKGLISRQSRRDRTQIVLNVGWQIENSETQVRASRAAAGHNVVTMRQAVRISHS